MIDVDEYVGLPYKVGGRDRAGIDCWGLCRLVYWDRLRKNLPSYDGYSLGKTASALIEKHAHEWQKVNELEPYDLVLFSITGMPHHIGLSVGDGWMLHAIQGKDSCLERIQAPMWRSRLEGFYRVR